MNNNITKYKDDFTKLLSEGNLLHIAMQLQCDPVGVERQVKEHFKNDSEAKSYIKELPNFGERYQSWYSQALVLVKQLLPDRLNDFIKLYEKPKTRKSVEYGNYVIEDFLQNLRVSRGGSTLVDASAAIPQFFQQLKIIEAISSRFESTLFDIRLLLQADLFDSELESAKSLLKGKYTRAAGALCGVLIEKHLYQVVRNHNLALAKKEPTINDLNELLKTQNVIDVAQWRFIQHLGDIRNLCSHNKEKEPSKEQVDDLIQGVEKIMKTIN